VWTRTTYPRAFWDRYLKVFDQVKIVARAESKLQVDENYQRVTGKDVQFAPVPFYLGPWQYLKARTGVRDAVREAVNSEDAVLCRVASQIASDLLPEMWAQNRPYGLEVVGDPYEAFAPGAIKHPLRPYLRQRATRLLKEQCARAGAVSYVTERALQRRYPCEGQFAAAVSDVDLQLAAYRTTPRTFAGPTSLRLIFVGSLEQMYKGQDTLLHAAAQVRKNMPLELRVVGTGRHRSELEQLARSLSLQDCVHFTGELTTTAVRSELDNATLMVLPSRAEGLPRVIVEAMARALPCIASNVGGIPELLAAEDLVAPNNPQVLAAKIAEVLGDNARLSRMSARNLEKSQQFRPEILERRRTEFYSYLRDTTREWLAARRATDEVCVA
jgi:glycosyltransferase involved in cell wall biosynthesis